MHRDVEAGLGALFDFSFDKYLTISITKVVYRLTFALACLNALVSVILIFTYVGDLVRYTSYGSLVQIAMLALTGVFFLVFLAAARLWLEAFVVHFKGHQKELATPAPATKRGASDSQYRPVAGPVTQSAAAHWACSCGWVNDGTNFCGNCGTARMETLSVNSPEINESIGPSWTCRCGHINPTEASACLKCSRSPNAIN